MAAKSVGVKLGRAVGWIGATAWQGTCQIASATGELGEGFLEGAELGYEERTAVMLANQAKRVEARAAALRMRADAASKQAAALVAA